MFLNSQHQASVIIQFTEKNIGRNINPRKSHELYDRINLEWPFC